MNCFWSINQPKPSLATSTKFSDVQCKQSSRFSFTNTALNPQLMRKIVKNLGNSVATLQQQGGKAHMRLIGENGGEEDFIL